MLQGMFQTHLAVGRQLDLVAFELQTFLQQQTKGRVILHNQNSHRRLQGSK